MALAGCFIGTDATLDVAPVGVLLPVAGALPESAMVTRWVRLGLIGHVAEVGDVVPAGSRSCRRAVT